LAIFTHFIFAEKANCENVDFKVYTEHNLSTTSVRLDDNLQDKSMFLIKLLPTLHYLNHALFNDQQIYNTQQRGDKIIASYIYSYLGRLGFRLQVKNPQKRVYSAGGATLSGSFYHDYGYLGVCGAGVLVACLWMFGVYLITKEHKVYRYGLMLIVGSGLIILYSNLFFAIATISYPFIIFSFAIFAIFGRSKCLDSTSKRDRFE